MKISDAGFNHPALITASKPEIKDTKAMPLNSGLNSSVALDTAVKKLLFDTLLAIQKRESALDSLTPEIRGKVRDILQQNFSIEKVFTQGISALLRAPQKTSDILMALHDGVENVDQNHESYKLSNSRVKRLPESIGVTEITVSADKNQDRLSLAFALPLYANEAEIPYPVYVHVYHENHGEEELVEHKGIYRTWLRICLITENLGRVDVLFRLGDGNELDVRIHFQTNEAAQLFRTVSQELKETISKQPLKLIELTVTATSG